MSAVRSSSTPVPGFISAPGSNPRSHPAPSMRHLACSALAVLLALLAAAHPSSAQDSPEVIRQKIEAEYPLTKTTASRDDIVTAGAVLVLEKDGLEMSATANNVQAQDVYKGGKVSPSGGTSFAKGFGKCSFCPHNDKAGTFRTFVAGEKFWLTKVEVRDDGVYLSFFSDPISDVRYTSILKIPFIKGQQQSAAALLATIAEVIKVDGAQPQDKAAPAPGAAAPAAPMAPIPPPPPPPDAPPPASATRVPPATGASNQTPATGAAKTPTVEIGQTKDQVFAILGAPTRIAKLPTKEIDFYPDMKITFVKDKVSDIHIQ